MMKHFLGRISFVVGLLISSGSWASTMNNFECPQGFDCPDAIMPKVAFWADVYATYSEHHVILSDTRRPDLVYLVLDERAMGRAVRCSSSDPFYATTERKLVSDLRRMMLENETPDWIANEEHYEAILSLIDTPPTQSMIKCQHGRRLSMIEAYRRYLRYKDMILEKLTQANLPLELQYLPFVESRYNPKAVSRSKAVGIWQFMKNTGRMFGLTITPHQDDRKDPEKSTDAAIKYFQKWNRCFEQQDCNSWPFTITSYNYGGPGTLRAARFADYDYVYMIEEYNRGRFKKDVKNYYSSFLAATHVFSQPERFFPEVASVTIQPKPAALIQYPREMPKTLSYRELETVEISTQQNRFSKLFRWLIPNRK